MILKRLIPSLRRRLRVLLGKRYFWSKIQDCYFYLDIQDKLHRNFHFSKKYESNNFKFIKDNSFLQDEFIFIDIGANIGIYSIFVSKYFKNCINIYAFEPIPRTFNFLKKNIAKNNIKNIKLHNIALSDQNKNVTMSTLSKNGTDQSAIYSIKNKNGIQVKSNKLDNIINLTKKRLFVKCDTEGHDLNVMRGMINNLKQNKCLIQIENNNKTEDIGDLLKQFNFELIKINDRDFFFTNDNLHN